MIDRERSERRGTAKPCARYLPQIEVAHADRSKKA